MAEYKMKDLVQIHPALNERRLREALYIKKIAAAHSVSLKRGSRTWEFESDETAYFILDKEIKEYNEYIAHCKSHEGQKAKMINRVYPSLNADNYAASSEYFKKEKHEKHFTMGKTELQGIRNQNLWRYLRHLSRTEYNETTKIIIVDRAVFVRKDALSEVGVSLNNLHRDRLSKRNKGSSEEYNKDIDILAKIAGMFNLSYRIEDREQKIVWWNGKKCKLNKLGRPISVTTGEDLYREETLRRSRKFSKQSFGGAKKLEQKIGGL